MLLAGLSLLVSGSLSLVPPSALPFQFPPSTIKSAEDPISFAALGDWGTSPAHDSSTQKDKPGTVQWNEDYNSQQFLGYVLGQWAAQNQAKFVVGHGDNFYWNGVWSSSDGRWKETFEGRYPNPALFIKWYNVMGNHDYGGGSNIGGGREKMEQLLQAQRGYKSPNGDRWRLSDSYYKATETFGNLTIDIFNIDTNAAPIHGYDEICCQCYGYPGKGCGDAACRGQADYQGGCAPVDQVTSCREYLQAVWKWSMGNLTADLASSKATWKIVNSHYSPRLHMSQPQQSQIYSILNAGKPQIFMHGHTHGEGHEYLGGVHYLMNGAGGGIKAAGTGMSIWAVTAYAFIGARVWSDKMEVTFYGFDDHWGNFDGKQMGGVKVLHCWIIPVNGAVGQAC
jgi:hypothetical protein